MRDVEECHPVELAINADKNDLINEPAFLWWVPYTLKRKDRTLSAVKARTKCKTH